jgi:hypothetical protein
MCLSTLASELSVEVPAPLQAKPWVSVRDTLRQEASETNRPLWLLHGDTLHE